jgi:hypothetical protein
MILAKKPLEYGRKEDQGNGKTKPGQSVNTGNWDETRPRPVSPPAVSGLCNKQELLAFFVIAVKWGVSFKDKYISRICRFVIHYPALMMTVQNHVWGLKSEGHLWSHDEVQTANIIWQTYTRVPSYIHTLLHIRFLAHKCTGTYTRVYTRIPYTQAILHTCIPVHSISTSMCTKVTGDMLVFLATFAAIIRPASYILISVKCRWMMNGQEAKRSKPMLGAIYPLSRHSPVRSTVMRRTTTFRSTTDRIYDGGPISL